MPETQISIRLFGVFEMQRSHVPLPSTRTRKEQWLVALLLLRHPHPLERSWLACTLWPDSSDDRALLNLRRSLTNLREVLGPDAARLLSSTPRTLQFAVAGAQIDLLTFEAALKRGDAAALQEAIALYRGELLEGCEAEWAVSERAYRENQYLLALETLAQMTAEAGEPTEAIGYLRRLIAADPTRESAYRRLMQALWESGDQAAVTLVYRKLRLYLHREMHAEPSPETTLLYQRLKETEKAAQGQGGRTADRREAANPISETTRLSRENSEGRTASETRCLPPSSGLFGRSDAITTVRAWLSSTSLVTLTGPGGIGKTALAWAVLQTAAKTYDNRVWLVPLADLASVENMAEAVRNTLGLPRNTREPLAQIEAYLAPHRALLALDNLEHLLPAGAHFVQELRERLPKLTILATSRVRLHLPDEGDFAVSPLPVPGKETGEMHLCPSVQLFVSRARSRRGDFQLSAMNSEATAQVCTALEGIPLALELAAAWSHLLTPAQMLPRLEQRFALLKTYRDDLPERHRSLRAVMETSYRLLFPQLQNFFARLSVFRGGWTLEAAEVVCEEPNALEALSHLHDASLIQIEEVGTEMRCRLLETLREFAAEQLSPEAGSRLQKNHAHFFAALAQQTETYADTPDEEAGLMRLKPEHHNLRQALTWLQNEPAHAAAALKMGVHLSTFWNRHAHFREGIAWLTALLKNPELSEEARCPALCRLGMLYERMSDYASALPFLEEALFLVRQGRGVASLPMLLTNIGNCFIGMSAYAEARRYYEEALEISRSQGNRHSEAVLLGNLGILAKDQGRYAEAQELLEGALRRWQEKGNRAREGCMLHNLGNVLREQQALAEARQCYTRSLQIHRRLQSRGWQGTNLFELGLLTLQEGDLSAAATLLEEARTLSQEVGDRFLIACCLEQQGVLAWRQGEREAARNLLLEALSLRIRIGAKREIAFTLEYLASLCLEQNEAEKSARLLGAAEALRGAIGSPRPPASLPEYRRLCQRLREILGEEKFHQAWAEGQTAPTEEIVAPLPEALPIEYGR